MAPSRATLAWAVLAAAAAVSVQQASAAISLRMPVIPWYSVLRGGYVDLITRQPVTTQLALANAGPVSAGNPGAFQQQTGLFNPAPRPTSRTIFPLTLPSLAFWEKCFKETDPLSALVTKCNYQDTFTTCTMLANMGYLPKGVQSFEAKTLTGSFALPTGCASASLGVSYDKLFRLTFNSPQVPILAVISKDPIGSMVSYFGTGTTQGRVKHRLAHKVEFCYAPTISEITVTKTAIYSTGMQPGTAAWAFAKSVELPQPYVNNRAVMFNGDSVDATWTLMAQKSGADVSYQGVVTGTISINNPTPAVITVTSIIDQVTSGPAATVVCPVGVPFTVPACSFATCQYTAYYPYAPPPGSYTTAAQVQFQVLGSAGYPSMAQGASVFNVGVIGAPGLAVSTATIPVGAAMVSDPQAPQGQYMFSGPGQQSFATSVTCGGMQASGAMSNSAVMTASTGQQIMQSATIQKQCYDLSVTVVPRPAPFVGRWGWAVSKTANPSTLRLKPNLKMAASPNKAIGFGKLFSKDAGGSTTGDVIYTVTYTRNPPAGFAAGAPAFEASGEVIVQNPAPINARLQSVVVTIANPNGAPYTTEAVCPMLTIPASQRVSCAWRANPTFNPVGQSVRGIARYINLRNGEPRGQTTDFTSAPATISGTGGTGPQAGAEEVNATTRGRALLQTWGGAAHHTSVGLPEELAAEPAVATTIYDSEGHAMVVPNSVVNGTGVIVSGSGLEAGSAPVMAMAQGVPVELPPSLQRSGLYINEAGPSPGSDGESLQGLQDECVDIADTFVTGDNAVGGQLISGTLPSGRICGTTTFSYTMRYGPYDDCQDRRSVNAATFQTVDTQTRGSSQSDVTIDLDTCANPAELMISPGPVSTIAQGGFTWLVSKRADVKELVIGQDATAVVTYTVDYKRVGNKAASAFAAEVTVENPTPYPIGLEASTYTATTMCEGAAKTTSGAIACDAETVPAQSSIKCKVSAAAPCIGHGAYTVVLTAAGGFSITSPPAPFVFDTKQLEAKASLGECADVRDSFELGEGRVGGAVVSGTRPNGRLCGSKTFTYSVRYGPFSDCAAKLLAVNTASLTPSSGAGATSTTSTLPITVVGCDLYAPAKTPDADCVKDPHWWSKCNPHGDDKCAAGWMLLPGGKGKGTLFFPKPNERSARNYTAMLLTPPHEVVLNEARRVYQEAAKQFVAAQLNFLSGARLPTMELQETFDALNSFLSTSSEGTAADEQTIGAIAAQADLLGAYNNGTLPGAFKAPPKCL